MEIREKERRGMFRKLTRLSIEGELSWFRCADEEGKQDECRLLKLEIGKMKERERSYKAQVEKVSARTKWIVQQMEIFLVASSFVYCIPYPLVASRGNRKAL